MLIDNQVQSKKSHGNAYDTLKSSKFSLYRGLQSNFLPKCSWRKLVEKDFTHYRQNNALKYRMVSMVVPATKSNGRTDAPRHLK